MSPEEAVAKFKNFPKFLKGLLYVLIGLVILTIIGSGIFYAFWVTDIKQHSFAYKVDRLNDGELTVIKGKGWTVNTPLRISVYQIDTRPEQRCLKSGRANVNQRLFNCKLIAFNPEGLTEFIKLHGVQEGNVTDILEAYAFDQLGRDYSFLKIVDQQTVVKN